jgi:hypothetical protein
VYLDLFMYMLRNNEASNKGLFRILKDNLQGQQGMIILNAIEKNNEDTIIPIIIVPYIVKITN